jgi:hypothetical protein
VVVPCVRAGAVSQKEMEKKFLEEKLNDEEGRKTSTETFQWALAFDVGDGTGRQGPKAIVAPFGKHSGNNGPPSVRMYWNVCFRRIDSSVKSKSEVHLGLRSSN